MLYSFKRYEKALRMRNRIDQKKSHQHIIIKTLNTLNKEKVQKDTSKSDQITYKGNLIRIVSKFSVETLKWKVLGQMFYSF